MTDLARESPGPTSSRPATKKRTTSRRGSGTIATPASTTQTSPQARSVVGQQKTPSTSRSRRRACTGRQHDVPSGPSEATRPSGVGPALQRTRAASWRRPRRDGPGGTLVTSGLERGHPWTDPRAPRCPGSCIAVRRRLIGFDLDGTLAVTKSPIPDLIAERLADLLAVVDVCVVSGGDFSQFQQQLIARLDVASAPTSPGCTSCRRPARGTSATTPWPTRGACSTPRTWRPQRRDAAIGVLTDVAKSLGYWEPHPTGDIIEDRGSQVTFSALGQQASPDAKYAWDPDGAKRRSMRDRVAAGPP